ncbi:MAG: hypothetical protein QW757_05095 [Candidatus Woesearchaeota archaeon]
MKKTMLLIFFLVVALTSVYSDKDKFCNDPDGLNIWQPNTVVTEKGNYADDCDGASENLKEYTCKDDQEHPVNVKCSDYNAVCVSVGDKTEPDYCACQKGYVFSETENKCVVENQIPEFSTIGSMIALLSVAGLFVFLRRR